MTFVAVGQGFTTAQLLADVVHHLRPEWPHQTTRHDFGAVLVAGPHHRSPGGWLVAGHPVCDPWGMPTAALPLETVGDELDGYGAAAITMVAGPALAIDLKNGEAHRTLGGLIGFGPHADDLRVSSTVGRSTPPVHTPVVPDSSPAFTYERLAAEVGQHVGQLGEPLDLMAHTSHPWPTTGDTLSALAVHSLDRTAAVLHPSGAAEILANPTAYAAMRDGMLPELHYRCAQIGRTLYAPMFERPVLDQLGFGAVVA